MKIKHFQPIIFLAKSSILDVRLALGCASVQTYVMKLYLLSPEYPKDLIPRVNG